MKLNFHLFEANVKAWTRTDRRGRRDRGSGARATNVVVKQIAFHVRNCNKQQNNTRGKPNEKRGTTGKYPVTQLRTKH